MNSLRSKRLKQSYNIDKCSYVNMEDAMDDYYEDLLPQSKKVFVIDSEDDGLDNRVIESESEVQVQPPVMHLEEDDAVHRSEVELSDDAVIPDPDVLFMEMHHQFRQIAPPLPEPVIVHPDDDEEEEVPEPVDYEEYKHLLLQEIEEKKIQEAKHKMRERDRQQQQQPLAQPHVHKDMVGPKEGESMGDFMARIVKTFDKGRHQRVRNFPTRTRSASRSESRFYSQTEDQQQYLAEMMRIYNEDRKDMPEQCELLNYDVLFKTKKIIQRALMPPPRFKDEFYFTHLYQEDCRSPPARRKGKKGQKGVGLKALEDKCVHFNYKPEQLNSLEDRQMRKLQLYRLVGVIGKRHTGEAEYMCNFEGTARRSWMPQRLLAKQYNHILMEFELYFRLRQLLTKVSDQVAKISIASSYCILSHRIGPNKEKPQIQHLKQHKPTIKVTDFVAIPDEPQKAEDKRVEIKELSVAREKPEPKPKSKPKSKPKEKQKKPKKSHPKQSEPKQQPEPKQPEPTPLPKPMPRPPTVDANGRQKRRIEPNPEYDSEEEEFQVIHKIQTIEREKEAERNQPKVSFKQQLQDQKFNKLLGEVKQTKVLQTFNDKFSDKFKKKFARLDF